MSLAEVPAGLRSRKDSPMVLLIGVQDLVWWSLPVLSALTVFVRPMRHRWQRRRALRERFDQLFPHAK